MCCHVVFVFQLQTDCKADNVLAVLQTFIRLGMVSLNIMQVFLISNLKI